MQPKSEFRFSRLASSFAAIAAVSLAACGGTDKTSGGTSNTCTIALSASTDDAHLQAAIENALRIQNPCNLPDAPLRKAEARTSGPDVRTSYQLVRVERDEQAVRAVFEAVPETRSSETGE
jgi:hypothetical protein